MTERFDALYLVLFVSTAAVLLALERVGALQFRAVPLARRTASNVGLFLTGNLFAALLIPVGVHAFALAQPPGLVSGSGLPPAAQGLLTFLLLDLWRYGEHRLFHRWPLLWRLHRVHHSDLEIDVTTSERHHPLDVLLGTAVTMAVIALLGLPAFAVDGYLIAVMVVSLGSHANLRLPWRIDRVLRGLVVTPSVHAVHHSALQPQTDSNYGAVLSIWDRLFGSYNDPAVTRIERIGLEAFRAPGDARFLRILKQPFVDERAPTSTEASDEADAAWRAWRQCLVLAAAGAGAVTLVMWPAWVELAAAWRGSEAFHWGWLVLPLMVYLLGWHRRADLLTLSPRPDLGGVLPCVVAAALWVGSDLMNLNVGRQLALVVALQGVAMSALGWHGYRQFFATLALLFLMIPSADLLQPALRALTVHSIGWFATVAGLPHQVDGFVVLIGARRYVVVDECSGLAYVSLAMFLGYAFGLLLYRSAWKVVALAACGAALGVLCNLVRVNAIVAIDWISGSQMDLAAHGGIQWLALFALLGLLLFALLRLPGEPAAPPASSVDPRGDAAGRWLGPVLAGAAVLCLVGGAQALIAPSSPMAAMADAMPPGDAAGWSRDSAGTTWLVASDGSTRSLESSYRRGAERLQLRVVQALSVDAKLPALRTVAGPPGGHWREVRTEAVRRCDGAVCAAFEHVTWRGRTAAERRHAYAAYCSDALVTDSTLAFRAAHAWQRLAGRAGDRRAVALTIDGEGLPAGEAARLLLALQAAPERGAALP